MMFGRLPADPARIAAAPSLRKYGLVPPPPVVNRDDVPFTPELYENDVLPDCTAVTLANCAQAASWALTGAGEFIDPASVPSFYAASIGHAGESDAALAATDGAVLLDVLAFQSRSGFHVGQQAPLVASFGTVDPTDRAGIAAAVYHLGACALGVTLHQKDMDTFGAGVWDDDGSDQGAVVGGHALFAWAYTGLSDDDLVQVGTWGNWQYATWRFLAARLDEAHGLMWNDRAPGLDYVALKAAIKGFVA